VSKQVNIVIADSSKLVRIGLKSLLANYNDLIVVGEAETNEDLKKVLSLVKTDVLLIDYTSDGFNIDIIPNVIQQNKKLKIVAITPEQSGTTIINAIRGGVCSYIKKDCDINEIIDSIRETAKGEKFFCGKCKSIS